MTKWNNARAKSEYARRYRETHREEIKAYQRAYYLAHHDECLERSANRRIAKPDEIKESKQRYYWERGGRKKALDYYAEHSDELQAKAKVNRVVNRDKITARDRKRYNAQPKHVRIAKAKAYFAAHAEEIIAKRRGRYLANKERILAIRKEYYIANRERILAKAKERYRDEQAAKKAEQGW